jgi:hypothetical protein
VLNRRRKGCVGPNARGRSPWTSHRSGDRGRSAVADGRPRNDVSAVLRLRLAAACADLSPGPRSPNISVPPDYSRCSGTAAASGRWPSGTRPERGVGSGSGQTRRARQSREFCFSRPSVRGPPLLDLPAGNDQSGVHDIISDVPDAWTKEENHGLYFRAGNRTDSLANASIVTRCSRCGTYRYVKVLLLTFSRTFSRRILWRAQMERGSASGHLPHPEPHRRP